jgi:lipopolysaccharide/colanic/teichoic acid biosynthesis glycosyltransferase
MTTVDLAELLIRPSAATLDREEARVSVGPEGPRRVLNVVVASVGILLTAPLMLVVALLIKLTSRGPVIYKQTRIGLDRRGPGATGPDARRTVDLGGRPFTIYKFRTMAAVAPGRERQVWAQRNDPRVTKIGKVLRQFRLDELPQLFNVLMGDMNVVGPRPEQPKLFQELRTQIPDYQARQRVRPGITGWAQVNQQYDTSLEDVKRKVELDLEYVGRQGLVEDFKIMLLTFPTMVFRRGAW